MILLFASERSCYPFTFDGGAEITTYNIADNLSAKWESVIQLAIIKDKIDYSKKELLISIGFEISQVAKNAGSENIAGALKVNSLQCKKGALVIILVNHIDFYEAFINILQSSKVALVITCLKGSSQLIQIAEQFSVPALHRIFGIDKTNFPTISGNTHMLANSPTTSKACERIYKRKVPFIYSPVNYESYLSKINNPEFVTIINPRAEKGLHDFCKFCRLLPDIPFLVVQGWSETEYSDDEIQAFRFLQSLSNVKIVKSLFDISQIYQVSKVLLVPSVWMEAFGRVVLEAQVNGIPLSLAITGIPLTCASNTTLPKASIHTEGTNKTFDTWYI